MTNSHLNKDRASQAMALLHKNHRFFKKNHPNIYGIIKDLEFTRYTLDIDKKTGCTEVFDGKKGVYSGDLDTAIEQEIADYTTKFAPGNRVSTVTPPVPNSIVYPRFFSNRLKELTKKVPVGTNVNGNYKIPEYYPTIFFMGCWSGLHIDKFLRSNNVLQTIIFEPDPERFCLSLYLTDWEDLHNYCAIKDNKIVLHIAGDKEISNTYISNIAWNIFVSQCPSFPLISLFYNHLGNLEFEPIIKRVKEDMHLYLNQWGYYDDEINQLNNAFHNIAVGIPALPQSAEKKKKNIFIIGAGPSLDDRIEDIKKNIDKAIIVSCGSGLRPLVKNGIIPDYHVELESHMFTHEMLSKPEYSELHKKTTFISALQLPPNVFELFEKKYFFVKDSTALSELFIQDDSDVIRGVTPTCTNAGFAVFSHLNYENIYLFGLDFGFKDLDNHHSRSSIYFENGNSKGFDQDTTKNFSSAFEVESVNGDKIFSISMYCTSRRALENCLVTHKYRNTNFKVYNCSDGAKIKGTEHLSRDNFSSKIINTYPLLKTKQSKDILADCAPLTYETVLREKISELEFDLTVMCNEIKYIINQYRDNFDLADNFKLCEKINNHLLKSLNKRFDRKTFLIRGSIWHILHTGMSYGLAIENVSEKSLFIKQWQETFIDLLETLPAHYHSITKKEYPDKNDPWIHEDIAGNEANFLE
ncbi:MAG: 6-hydroxymethylpterin diphosphokinase MptE-like protein [Oleispira sp.]